jgi:hypothetical protein
MAQRNQPSTAARGYGWRHQRLRAALLATYRPTDLCWRCSLPLGSDPQLLDLGHVDGDKTRYRGLEHASCNRATNRGRRGRSDNSGIKPGTVRDRRGGGTERWSDEYGWVPCSRRW